MDNLNSGNDFLAGELSMRKFDGLTRFRLEEILDKIRDMKIAVIGDGSLDIYWEADMTVSQISRETPHFPLPVFAERLSLGGGANVAANLVDLGIKKVDLLTVIGRDWRGAEFKKLIEEKGIEKEGLVETSARFTPAYCKPIRHGLSDVSYEAPRLDFINKGPINSNLEEEIINNLHNIISKIDVLIVCDQLINGVITSRVRDKINRLGQENLIVVDSRNRIGKFNNVVIKPNQFEALRAVDSEVNSEETDFKDWVKAGVELMETTGEPLVMTLGSRGALWFDNEEIIEVPAVPVEEPLDIVGAGDGFHASFAIGLAAGARPEEAISIANLAAAVVVEKIRITGTATRAEIINKYEEVNGGD